MAGTGWQEHNETWYVAGPQTPGHVQGRGLCPPPPFLLFSAPFRAEVKDEHTAREDRATANWDLSSKSPATKCYPSKLLSSPATPRKGTTKGQASSTRVIIKILATGRPRSVGGYLLTPLDVAHPREGLSVLYSPQHSQAPLVCLIRVSSLTANCHTATPRRSQTIPQQFHHALRFC